MPATIVVGLQWGDEGKGKTTADPGAATLLRQTRSRRCFDDASFLRHVAAAIARLDRLVPMTGPATPTTRTTP